MRYLWLALSCFSISLHAHQLSESKQSNTAHYLGNEAVLVSSHDRKVLFDPFFHNDFGHYQKVPEDIRQAIFDANAPFDGIDLIVISHAHEDHFSAPDVARYLSAHEETVLVAPQQAIKQLASLTQFPEIQSRLHAVALQFGDPAWQQTIRNIQVDAVRIPHAGWPGRANVENLVFRLTFSSNTTVMHMGDADPQIEHYLPHQKHWDTLSTQLGFPPYWFLQGAEGREILKTVIHVEQAVGVHVPVKVPKLLIRSGQDYFSNPGETRTF